MEAGVADDDGRKMVDSGSSPRPTVTSNCPGGDGYKKPPPSPLSIQPATSSDRPDSGYFSEITPTQRVEFFLNSQEEVEEEEEEDRDEEISMDTQESETMPGFKASTPPIDIPNSSSLSHRPEVSLSSSASSSSSSSVFSDSIAANSHHRMSVQTQTSIEEQDAVILLRIQAQTSQQQVFQRRRVFSESFPVSSAPGANSMEGAYSVPTPRERSNSLPPSMLSTHQALGRELRRIGDELHEHVTRGSLSSSSLSSSPTVTAAASSSFPGAQRPPHHRRMWQWLLQTVGLNNPAVPSHPRTTTLHGGRPPRPHSFPAAVNVGAALYEEDGDHADEDENNVETEVVGDTEV